MASSFEANFNVKGLVTPLKVISSSVVFSQPTDTKGRASAGVRSGQIMVRLLGDEQATIAEWAINPMKALDGEITFIDPTTNATFSTLAFKDTYCVSYRELFNVGDGTAAYTFELGLTARKILVDAHLHDNMWSNWMVE